MRVSIIIPAINEAPFIGRLIHHLIHNGGSDLHEVIVVDGGSSDQTCLEAKDAGSRVIKSNKTGRAVQMNLGASHATGDLLWFVHADSIPPKSYLNDLKRAFQSGDQIGGYRFKFDSRRLIHRFLSWCTRFPLPFTRGGDQTLFITRQLFDELKGFNEDYVIMEEYDLIKRAKKRATFRIIPKSVIVSARKYDENNWLKVQWANFVAFRMFSRGENPVAIKKAYHSLIKHPKDY